MTNATTSRPSRRPAKPGGRKTANRFANLAGGTPTAEPDLLPQDGTGSPATDGLIGGISTLDADTARRIVQIQVAEIAPHPFNDAARSEPQAGDPKWEELLNGVRAKGVQLPVLVAPLAAFADARPTQAERLPQSARYVLIYGHRRRAAALAAGCNTVPAVVDDTIMANDGDLDAMATENLGRQDLSDLAEADLFARYSEIGLSQRAIAERLGIDQATVSRRLALLLLAPEVRESVDEGKLSSADAAVLAGKLPYGPQRPWQKGRDAAQNTDQRRAEQIEAQRLVVEHKWLASRAPDRVIAERDARAQAADLGITLVDNVAEVLGADYVDHRITSSDHTPGMDVIGAINPNTGMLDLYRREVAQPITTAADVDGEAEIDNPVPDRTPPAKPADSDGGTAPAVERNADPAEDAAAEADAEAAAEAAKAKAAQALRRQACATLITHQPSNSELLKVLVRQYLSGVAARSQTSAVKALLRDWDATADGTGDKVRNLRAWHHAVAAAELHTAELKDKAWDEDAVAHVQLLVERVGYQPTAWERDQLATVAG